MTDIQIKLAAMSSELLRLGKDHADERRLAEAIVGALEGVLQFAGTASESQAFAVARAVLQDWHD